MDGSPIKENKREHINKDCAGPVKQEHLSSSNWHQPEDVYSQIERTFLHEVGNAEEIAKLIEPGRCI